MKLLEAAAAAALLALSTACHGQTQAGRDLWTGVLTAADLGLAVLPWTTYPRLEDECSPGYRLTCAVRIARLKRTTRKA